jgi:dimethylargininase
VTAFRRALVRLPGENLHAGLTTAGLGLPDHARVLEQHAAYCRALESCGLTLTVLPADPDHPDATFVEDTAVLTPRAAILTRPGAESRRGEVERIRQPLLRAFERHHAITAPGTVDGGDVCEVGTHVLVGISHRTNEEGARQLALLLAEEGLTSATVDIRGMTSILHLKSGLAAIDDGTLVVLESLAGLPQLAGYRLLRVPEPEGYSANCVRVNDRVLVASGYPSLPERLEVLGYRPLALDMSEFRKMDGGLSCLSLRY